MKSPSSRGPRPRGWFCVVKFSSFDAEPRQIRLAMNPNDPPAHRSPDWIYRGLLLTIALIAVWVLAMPWVPTIASITMRRFHLSSDSFIGFAIQQPVPAMYNFANRVEIRELDPEDELLTLIDPVLGLSPAILGVDPAGLPVGVLQRETVNHFPLRLVTFADGQYKYLRGGKRWIAVTSDYRGRRLTTRWRIDPSETQDQPWTMTRQSLRWTASP